MRQHLFVSSADGALYDTRVTDWSKKAPLRPVFNRADTSIATCAQLKAALRYGEYAWPGGYQMYFVTTDGAALSFKAVRENLRECLLALQANDYQSDWRVQACAINWEDSELICDHTGELIPAAYDDN